MNHLPMILAVIGVVLAFAFIDCNAGSKPDEGRSESESDEHNSVSESVEGRGESESSERNSGSESGERGSESESGEHNSVSKPDEGRGESESSERNSISESAEGRGESESGEHDSVSESGEGRGESESGEHSSVSESSEHSGESESGEGDEESGAQFALNETFDSIRAGARLVLSYDSTANAFTGTVENTTEDTLRRVRVEVHLSNGIELGPTTPVDLAPGETVDITLPASSQPFTSWTAHPEVD